MNSRILPALALILAVGIFFFYVNPTWSGSLTSTKAAIALDDQALSAAREYASQQSTLAAARAAIDPTSLDRLSAFLPDSVDNVGLILDLNALAARSGLSLANVDVVANNGSAANTTGAMGTPSSPGALSASAQNSVGSVNLSLTAVGTFSSLQTFLGGVERSARLLDVQDIVVKGSDTGVYTYQMVLRLYWLR